MKLFPNFNLSKTAVTVLATLSVSEVSKALERSRQKRFSKVEIKNYKLKQQLKLTRQTTVQEIKAAREDVRQVHKKNRQLQKELEKSKKVVEKQ